MKNRRTRHAGVFGKEYMDRFIASLAKKYVSRSKKTKWLFSFMSFFLVLILVTAVAITSTITATIRNCEDDYSTIGIVEYLGDQYPAMTQYYDETVASVQEAFEACLTESDALIKYEKSGSALGYIGEAKSYFNKTAADDSAVIVATIINDASISDTYVALCVQELFSCREIEGKYIDVSNNGEVLEKNHSYLMHGSFGTTLGGFAKHEVMNVVPFTLSDYGDIDYCVDITTGDHGRYTLPEDSVFYEMAESYKTVSRGVHVNFTDSPEDALPFHEGYISLAEGDFYAENGLIVSQFVAKQCGLSVGDEVTLRASAKENTFYRYAYSEADGFDCEQTVTLTGIFKDNSDYKAEAFASVIHGFDATVSNDSYTLGQLFLGNSTAQEYIDSLELPPMVRITLYDQGYKQNVDSLRTMLSLGYIISAVAAAAALVMMFLYGYMLVYKQEKELMTMVKLGCRMKQIRQYFNLICLRIASLPVILSAAGGYYAVSYLNKKLLGVLMNTDLSLYRYSSSAVSVVKKLDALSSDGSLAVILTVAAAALALILVSVGLFVSFVFKRPQKHRKEFHPVRGRTVGLSANGAKYALLTCVRDCVKNSATVVLIVAFSLLCSSLMVISVNTAAQMDTVRKNGDVKGYFTDIYGKNVSGLLIYYNDIENVSSIDGLTNVTGINTVPYEFCAVIKPDGTVSGPGAIEIPKGGFAQERLINKLASNPKLVCTTSVYGSPEFLYSPNIGIEWLDGYEDTDFAEVNMTESICVIGGKLAEKNGIALGDRVWLNVFDTTSETATLSCMNDALFKVVGIYEDDGLAKSIYVPSDFMRFTGAPVRDVTPMITEIIDGTEVHEGFNIVAYGFPTYSGATFTVGDCEKLADIKQALADFGYSSVNSAGHLRRFVEINDASYLALEQSMTQKLWCIEYLFPVIYAACVILSFIVARVNMRGKQGEIRIMHNLGTPRRVMFTSIMLNQLIQVIAGAVLGIVLMLVFKRCSVFGLEMLGACTLSYLAGSAATYRSVRNIDRKNARRKL